jgi:adenosylcobinamide-GDP ribazoletransferase
MKDPRLGTFAAIGLTLYLLMKTAFLFEMAAQQALGGIILAATIGRAAVFLTVRQPSARPGGMGDQVSRGSSRGAILFGLLPVVVMTSFQGLRGGIGLIFAGLVTLGIILLAKHRIGGVTGDVHGFVVEMAEFAVLLAYQTPSFIG